MTSSTDRQIGEWKPPGDVHRLTLHDQGGVAVLRRHRVNSRNGHSMAARVVHDGGVVREVAWTESAKPGTEWRNIVRAWMVARIAADHASDS